MSHFTDFTGYVLFIITSFLAGVESTDQCLLNSKVLSCFSGVIMSIRSFFLLFQRDYNFIPCFICFAAQLVVLGSQLDNKYCGNNFNLFEDFLAEMAHRLIRISTSLVITLNWRVQFSSVKLFDIFESYNTYRHANSNMYNQNEGSS